MPHTCVFLPNATTSGVDAQLLVGPRGSGHPAAGLHLVEDEQRVELVAQFAHRGEELRPEVAVAALALDRLGDEAGDVVRVRLERRAGLAQRLGFHRIHVGVGPDVRRVDARPVELREARDLVRVGVGQRQRVAAAAVERAAQVQHLGAEIRVDAARLVVPALPVERHLQRVLDRQRSPVDEEQVRQRRIAEHARERVDEARHRHAVDVGVARLVDRGLRSSARNVLVVGQRRVVHAQRRRREEREHVEVALAGAGVHQIRARRAVDVEDEVEAVGQDAARQDVADVGGADGGSQSVGVRTAVMKPS